MTTINEALDKVMELDFESREMLIEIAQKRQVEERRKEMAHNAKKATSAYKGNKTKAVSASEIITRLNSLA
jgi:hypothetical protein